MTQSICVGILILTIAAFVKERLSNDPVIRP